MASKKNTNGRSHAKPEPGSAGSSPGPTTTAAEWLIPFAECVDEFIWLVEMPSGQVLYVNGAFERLFGRPIKTFRADSSSILNMVHPDDRAAFKARQDTIATEPGDYNYRVVLPGGEVRWLNTRVYPIRDTDGNVTQLGGVTHDITSFKRTEQSLAESQQRYSLLTDRAPVGIIETDLKSRVVYVNQHWSELAGRSPEDALGTGWNKAYHPEDRAWVTRSWKEAAQNGTSQHLEYRLLRPDGVVIWVAVDGTPLLDEDGAKSGYIRIGRDITVQRETLAALEDREQRYRRLLETASDVVFSTDLDGRFTYANPAAERLTGYTQEQLTKMRFIDMVAPAERTRVVGLYVEQVASRTQETLREYPIITASGEHKWLEQTVSLVVDGGEVAGLQGIGRDVTARKLAEDALFHEQELLQALMDNIPDMIYFKDTASRFTRVNKAEAALLKIEHAEQAAGKTDFDFQLPEISTVAFAEEQEIVRTGHAVIDRTEFNPLPDGTPRWLSTTKVPIMDKQGQITGIAGLSRDITERKQVMEALRESEDTRKAILDAIPDMMFRLDREGTYLDVHAPDPVAFPMPPDQFVGHTVREMLPTRAAEQVMGAIGSVFGSGETLVAEEQDPFDPNITREVRIVKSGPDEVLLIVRDVTERKQAEEALRQSEAARNAILDAIPDMMFRVSRGGLVLDAHIPEMVRALIDPALIKGHTLKELIPEKLASAAIASFEKAFETGEVQLFNAPDEFGLGLIFEARTVVSGPEEALVVVRDVTERSRAEEALRQSEAARSAILDAIPDIMFRVKRDGTVIDHHAPGDTPLSSPSERYIGQKISSFVPPDVGVAVIQKLALAFESGVMEVMEYGIPLLNGEFAVVEARIVVSNPDEALIMARDVTESRRSQEALRQSESARKAMLEALPDLIFRLNREGIFLDVHLPNASTVPIPAEEFIGRHINDLMPPGFALELLGKLEEAFDHPGTVVIYESSDAFDPNVFRERRLLVSGPGEALMLVRDVTERKRSEEALRQSEAARKAILDALPDLIFRISREGVFLDVHTPNPAMLHTLAEELIGKFVREVRPAAYSDELLEKLGEAFSQPGQVVIYESPDPYDPDVFHERRILVSGPDEALMIVRDVTEARQAEDTIRESETRFRKLFELSPDSIVLIDPHANGVSWPIIDCNEVACQGNGYTRDEMIGQSIDILNETSASPAERKEYLERLREQGAFKGEVMHRRKDGSLYPVMYSTSIVSLGDRELVLGIDRDITERRESEEALEHSERRFRLLAERAPVGIFETDADGHITYVNPRWSLLTGRSLIEVNQADGAQVIIYPEDRERVTKAWDKARGERAEWYLEFRYERPHGEIVWVVGSATPIRDDLGEYIGYLGTVIDITHRKRAEEAEQEQRALAEALSETAATLNSTLDQEDVLNLILEKLGSVVPHEAANIMLVEDGNLRVVNQRGYHKRGQAARVSKIDVPLGDVPLMKQAYDKQEGVLVPDIRANPRWVQLRPENDLRSTMAAPIIRDGHVLGFLNLDSSTPGFFTSDHLHRLQAFADQASLALHNAQIYQQAQQEIEERKRAQKAEEEQRVLTEALRETAAAINSTLDLDDVLKLILEKLGSVVPHESANIMLTEGGRLRIATYHGYGEGGPTGAIANAAKPFETTPILREAGQSRQPMLVSDVADDPRWIDTSGQGIRSYVVAPIVRDDQVLGFLNLDSNTPGFFTEDHIPPLKAFAEQAAIALHNARVYALAQQEIADRKRAEEALWQQNDYLAGLHEVTLGLVQQVDQETRLSTVVTRAAALLDAQDAFLMVVDPGSNRMRMEYAMGRYKESTGSYSMPGQGQAGIAWETGRSQMTPDYQSMPGRRADRPWLRAAISTPLKIGTEVIGVLEAGFDHPVELDLERVFYLERFAELAALTFHNGRLYEQAQQEIAERKRAEIELGNQRDFATQVMDALGQGLTIADRQDKIVYANPAFEELTQHTLEELIGMSPTELVVEDDQLIVVAHSVSRFDNITDSYEVLLKRPDDSTVPVMVTGTPQTEGSEIVGSIALITDLSIQKKNEQALERQAAELQALYRASGGLIQAGRSPGDLATELSNAIAAELNATHASLWMISGEGKELELAGQARIPHPDDHRSYPVDGPGLLVEAYRTGQLIYSPDVREDTRYVEVLPGTLSKLVIPLRAEGHVVGVFTVERDTTSAFDEVSRRLFTVFAEQVGLALENMALIDALNSARRSAEDANSAKSDFLANMSHEIRTPLNGVLGIIELVLGTELNQQQRDDLTIAQQSAESLLGLINDILDLSKIEAGRLELEEVDFDLTRLVDQTFQIIGPRLKARVSLTRKIGAKVPASLRGDPIRLRQILINLLGNAAKFTSQGNVGLRVTVKQRAQERVTLHFEISDSGIGIPADKLDAIFEPFTQVDGSTTRKFGGTGLGLTIVRRLVDKFGGRIWVDSTIGQGSTFHFTAQLLLADAPVVEEQRPAAHQEGDEPLGKLRVLVAEDNKVNQYVMSGMLSKRNWDVAVAADGRQAADLALTGRFDVILMDVQMPGLDGFQVTALIRQSETPKGIHTPIIALTAHAMQGDRERCIAAGMDDYLSKPVKMEELYATIESVMTGRKVAKQEAKNAEIALSIFDRAEALHYIGDDVELLREVLIIFRHEWPSDVRQLEEAAASGDLQTLALISHRMKGQSGVLGGQETRVAAGEAEQLAKEGKLEDTRKAIKRLKAAVKRLDKAVTIELASALPDED